MALSNSDKIKQLVDEQQQGFSLGQLFYKDLDIYNAEINKVFLKHWLYAGHVSQISSTGDYFTFEFDTESVIIVRTPTSEVKAHMNVCRHRGSRICLEQSGSQKSLTCPYHAWSYNLDGELISARNMPDDFESSNNGLHQVKVELLGGFIFVCLSENPPSLDSLRQDLKTTFELFGMNAMKLAEQHRADPKDNIIGALLDGNGKDEGLDDDEFVWFFLMIMAAGNESTRTITSHGMRLLMDNPDQLQYLVDNPDKIENACEEMLRYNTAFIMMRRTAMEDVELAGRQIHKGDKIIMHYHTVNHDESVFGDDAMDFDVTRAERMPDLYNQHRSFGVGQHFCLGTHLARLEVKVMFEEIIPRIRNPKLVGELTTVLCQIGI